MNSWILFRFRGRLGTKSDVLIFLSHSVKQNQTTVPPTYPSPPYPVTDTERGGGGSEETVSMHWAPENSFKMALFQATNIPILSSGTSYQLLEKNKMLLVGLRSYDNHWPGLTQMNWISLCLSVCLTDWVTVGRSALPCACDKQNIWLNSRCTSTVKILPADVNGLFTTTPLNINATPPPHPLPSPTRTICLHPKMW